jgi:hypothetical protein
MKNKNKKLMKIKKLIVLRLLNKLKIYWRNYVKREKRLDKKVQLRLVLNKGWEKRIKDKIVIINQIQ